MDIYSEQKSQYKPYSEEIVSRARPPMVKKPNNLFLTGDIELFPEYRTSFVPYSLDSINKCNKPLCYHPKRDKKVKKSPPKEYIPAKEDSPPPPPPDMSERNKPMEAKILNNNYGVSCANRYHQKLDTENNYMGEYRSKYQPVIAQRSTSIPQPDHLRANDGHDDFRGASEYTNRYKSYDHFTKSAPIKKQDNLHTLGYSEMRPEYKERYKGVDMNTFERRQPFRQQDNLHSVGDFGRDKPEYVRQYKDHHVSAFPERAKPKHDFLCLNGEMDYSPEYRKNYVEFPRQRPIVKKQPTSIRMPSSHERDRKIENIDLPINLSYHETGSSRAPPVARMDSRDEEVSLESRPEYRRAMREYMIKERSPSRASEERTMVPNDKTVKVTDPNDVTKILMDNKVNVPEEKIFDENNEVIVEPLKKPENFKIPTRSPVRHAAGKGPSYPLQKDHRFHDQEVMTHKRNSGNRRSNLKVTIDDFDMQNRQESYSFDEDYQPHHMTQHHIPQHQQHMPQHQPSQRKSPKFGRRAPNLIEDYNLRTKTNVIEANPRYVREKRSDVQPNRHDQRAYYHQSNPHPIPMAPPPTESLANNYRPNYEIDKQQNYRESLRSDKNPFVVIDQRDVRGGNVKPNSWMKKQWYDTQ